MGIARWGVVGYGEVGKTFALGFKPHLSWTGTWDLGFVDPVRGPAMLEHAQTNGVQACTSAEELAQQVDLVVSAVTASNAPAVAQAVAHAAGTRQRQPGAGCGRASRGRVAWRAAAVGRRPFQG
jgi:3-hydroxyisobutyrate dehydrogenase-like beta-hydroxyacid dehydrogenase